MANLTLNMFSFFEGKFRIIYYINNRIKIYRINIIDFNILIIINVIYYCIFLYINT